MIQEKITVHTSLNLPKSKAWEYYTNPKHIVNWNFADPGWHCPKAINDMKVGGIFNARMEARDGSFGFDFEVTYTEIKEGEGFTYEFGERLATITFDEKENTTEINVVFDPETENSIELQKNGWQAILNNYKNYTENN